MKSVSVSPRAASLQEKHVSSPALRHNGFYQFTAFVENQETGADCSVDVQFSLPGVSAPFAKILSADLSAQNSKGGLALKGVPSSDSLFDQNTFDGSMNPTYWEEVLGATGTFGLIAAWKDYEGYAEEPDSSRLTSPQFDMLSPARRTSSARDAPARAATTTSFWISNASRECARSELVDSPSRWNAYAG